MVKKPDYPSGVRPNGSGIQIEVRYKGVRYRPTLKMTPTRKNLRDAVSIRESIRRDIAHNTFDPNNYFTDSKIFTELSPKYSSKITVSELIDDWLKNVKETKRNSCREYELHINKHIKPYFGKIRINDLSVSNVRKFQQNISTKVSPKTVNNIMIVLRQSFMKAFEDELIRENPLERIKNLKVEKKKVIPLTIEEVESVLNCMNNSIDYYNFYKFAIWTGLSTGEQLGLKWSDYDTEERTINIQRIWTKQDVHNTKNKFRRRRIELIQPAIDALNAIKNLGYKSEWIFVDPKSASLSPWRSEKIASPWNDALKQCNLIHIQAYATRHTYASIMLSAGMSLEWLKEKMGHSNYRMLEENYASWMHVKKKDKIRIKEWVFKWSENGHIPEADNEYFLK